MFPISIRVGCGLAFISLLFVTTQLAGQAERLDEVESTEERERSDSEQARLQKELSSLKARSEQFRALAEEYRKARDQAPVLLREVEQDIEKLSDRSSIDAKLDLELPQLETELVLAQRKLAEAQQDANDVDAEVARRMKRRRQIPELLTQARERLREIEAAPDTLLQSESADISAQVAEQRRVALQAELEAYENELSNYDARVVLLSKRRDRAAASLAYYGALVGKLREAVKSGQRRALTKRNAEAERLLTAIEDLPREVREVARRIVEQNAALAKLWVGKQGLIEKVNTVTGRLERARSTVSQVEADLAALSAKVDAVGLSDSVGTLLRRQRAEVPDVGMYRRFVRMRQTQIGEAQLQQIRLQERREELSDIDALVQETVDSLEKELSGAQKRAAQRILRTLYDHQRQYMDALVVDYETYFQRLVDFDAEQRTLIERSEALMKFIDERVLWMPSGSPIGPQLMADVVPATRWLFVPRFWQQIRNAVLKVIFKHLAVSCVLCVFVVLMLMFGRRVRRRLRTLSERISAVADSASGLASIEALGLTGLTALWIPILLLLMGEAIGSSSGATLFVRSIAHGLSISALYFGALRFISVVLCKHGLAEVYAGWDSKTPQRIAYHLRWLIWTTVPMVFIVFVFETRGDDAARESLGRLAFIAVMFPTIMFSYLMTRPRGPFTEILRNRQTLRNRAWVLRLVQGIVVAGPLALSVAAVAGYYWTALRFSLRYFLMMGFLFLLFVALDIVRTWMRRAERRLARDRLQRQAASAARSFETSTDGGAQVEEASLPSEEQVDLAVVSRQTGRLSLVFAIVIGMLGLSLIWADLFPAAGILREVELWQVTRDVTTTSVDATGVERSMHQKQLAPITLADLAIAILIASFSWLLLRNLPGLFEVTLFRRLQPGERYAYATIIKYIIALTGAALAFDAIGVGWSSIQWLIAAIGLGLGFGLQEIFANFVSGLIILLERPIRVGDVVTVDGVSGTVTRIRIRATWITAFDRKELVVPNKEFVTSRLVNWSLSDPVVRFEIPVGIAYGSDVQKAIEILYRVARQNRSVLNDPAPLVLFLSFGDNALGLELRAFVGDPDDRITAMHELHLAINQAFAENHIEIAFPQMDLHVRDLPEGMRIKETMPTR